MSATTPGETESGHFYDSDPLEPVLVYQGEILFGVPFLNMPKDTRWLLLRTGSGRPVEEALRHGGIGGTVKVLDSNQGSERWNDAGDGDYVMARLSKRPVLVLSQTCNVQTKDFIQIAPIFPADGDQAHIDKLRQGLIMSAFWMKAHSPDLAEGYADLDLIQAVHKSYIKRLLPSQHFRLSAAKTRELQIFLTRYFGRPNCYDAGAYQAPRDGTYLCIGCFYFAGVATAINLVKGETFQLCATCGQRGWVLKGR